MNVYQKMLVKLFESTDGDASKKVDLKEIVKSEGFLPSYPDIFKQMSSQGWIADAGREDVITVTPWGLKEAKKLQTGEKDDSREVQKNANRLKESVKELSVMTEELAGDVNEKHFKSVEKKFAEVKELLENLKGNF